MAEALRRLVPDLRIDWFTQEPVSSLLLERGETLHPRSRDLVSEVTHIEMEMESQSIAHDLHAFQAFRRMGEILVANFLTFLDAVRDVPYDLWIADEGWDVDYFLHENPELKSAPYVWLTDFVGMLPMLPNEEFQTTDNNAEMIEQIARFPRVRDLALFVGNLADIVPDHFGPHYQRSGRGPKLTTSSRATCITSTPPVHRSLARCGSASALKRGSQSSLPRLEAPVSAAICWSGSFRRLPRSASWCPACASLSWPDRASTRTPFPKATGVEVRGYVPDLFEHLAACDLALVQGGLSTTMELVATGRPFLYFPLRNHFEQMRHVPHRLANYGVGTPARVDFDDLTPDFLAERIARALGQAPEYRPVEMGGPERAARLIANLL